MLLSWGNRRHILREISCGALKSQERARDVLPQGGRPRVLRVRTTGCLPGRDAYSVLRCQRHIQPFLSQRYGSSVYDNSCLRAPLAPRASRRPAFYPCSGRPKVSADVQSADFPGPGGQNLGSSRPSREPTPTRDVQGNIPPRIDHSTPLLGETQLKCRLTTIGSVRVDPASPAHRDRSVESRSTAHTQTTICGPHRLSGVGRRKTRLRVR